MANLNELEKGLLPTAYAVKKSAWIFILSVLAILIAVNFVLRYYSDSYAKDAVKLRAEAESKTAFFVENLSQAEAVSFYSKAINLKKLFNQHVYISKLLTAVEQNNHPFISIKSFGFEGENKRLLITGQAPSNKVLAEQILLWRQSELLNNPQVSNVTVNETGVTIFTVGFPITKKF